jgi:hypothetical protein
MEARTPGITSFIPPQSFKELFTLLIPVSSDSSLVK